MNDVDIQQISGLLNRVSGSDDFHNDYDLVIATNLYFYETLDVNYKYGLILINNDINKSVNVPLSLKSYLNMKSPADTQIMQVQSSYSLINILSNKYGINIIIGFIKEVKEDYFESYILFESMGEFICVNTPVSDIFCVKFHSDFPVYINNKIIKDKGIKYDEFLEHIDMGLWRVF